MANEYLNFDGLSRLLQNLKGLFATKQEISNKSDTTHTHDDVYYTEAEIDAKFSTVNTSISNITSGNTTIAKSEEANHATTADSATTANSATKATQDASGNVIASTYETKSDASAKLTEAKTYTDNSIETAMTDFSEITSAEIQGYFS